MSRFVFTEGGDGALQCGGCGAVPKSCRGRRIEPHFPFYPTPHPRVFSIRLRNGREGRGGKNIRMGDVSRREGERIEKRGGKIVKETR